MGTAGNGAGQGTCWPPFPQPRWAPSLHSPESSSYQIQTGSLKHILLKKRKTLAYRFSVGGRLSTWPAYASGQAILQNQKPCCSPEGRSKKLASLTIAKPRYLEELESYLRKELQSLDLTKENAQELKLQPYREIFEFFIEDFKTYKPLLSAIKNEYEVTLAHLREKIRSLEPLKAMLVCVSDECTRQIVALQEEEKAEITKLKKEKLYLLKLIDKMKEEKGSLQTQVNMLRKNMAKEYMRYINECDARKLLLADLNEMRNQQLEMSLRQVQDVKGEDLVKVTLALKIARQDLTKAQVELNTMKADYGDVVPRRDFESQEKKYSDLFEKMEVLQKDFDDLQKEYDTLLEIHQETVEERDCFYNELQQVQRSSTPRPDWAKCAEVISGGPVRWSYLEEGKTSDQLVDVLLEEIGTGVLKEKDSFPGLGKGDKVPVYLRYEGQVKNKKLNKKDVVNIVKEIWKEKVSADLQLLGQSCWLEGVGKPGLHLSHSSCHSLTLSTEDAVGASHFAVFQPPFPTVTSGMYLPAATLKGKQSSLPEFFLNYLQKKYGDASAFEWAYTIYENIKLYRSNEAMSLFYDILSGKVDEGLYHGQNQLISNLLKELTASDSSNSGTLMTEQFNLALRAACPLKSNDQIQELIDASRYKAQSTEDFIDYRSLFMEDEEGNAEPFIAKIRSQYASEKQEYLRELRNELGHMPEVKVDDLKTAFGAIDPAIDDLTLDAYICLAFQASKEQWDQTGSLPVDTVVERLLAGDTKRIGPLPEETYPSLSERGEAEAYNYC
ncbi:Translin-associated factor X-interacting protein 1 [Chelonia mydas]|uniref:Translin-associated factor X-interacting protein 1 n=1 Tax=Chelonia mydas TaxID=8469 RepID=M7BF82_CHEMY|nr:Translin-associated factor X-interacting protein 1 [Chelonia mydas]